MPESERQSKRQRISQACDYCRKRKSKCDGVQPVCSVCRLFRKPCTYGNAKKRGLQSGYVRGLETLLGLAFQHLPRSEVRIRTLLRHNYADVSFNDGNFSDHCTELWRTSDLAKDLDLLLVSGTEEPGQLPPLELSDAASPAQDAECPDVPCPIAREEPKQLTTYPMSMLPDNISELVDLYFQTTHSWFPIVERCDILRAMYDDEDNTHDDKQDQNESHRICLWSIITYTSSITTGNMKATASPNPEQIYHRVWSRLMADDQLFDLGHVQAILILILHEIGRGALRSAWILAAQANRMQMDLGARETQRPERYHHVVHGCLYLDTIVSALVGQPSLSTRKAYNELPDLKDDSIEEWETWVPPQNGSNTKGLSRRPLRVLSTFNLLSQLMQRLNKALEDPVDGSSLEDGVRDLQNWRSKLKKSHFLAKNVPANPPILILHLTWDFAILTLFRRACEIDRRWIRLIQSIASSTLEKITQYLELAGVSGSSPLLVTFGLQAERCLDEIAAETGKQDCSSLRARLSTVLQMLKSHRSTTSNTETAPPLPEPRPGLVSGADLLASPTSSAMHRDALLSSLSADQSLSEVNGFDYLFDEMLSFVPSRRLVYLDR